MWKLDRVWLSIQRKENLFHGGYEGPVYSKPIFPVVILKYAKVGRTHLKIVRNCKELSLVEYQRQEDVVSQALPLPKMSLLGNKTLYLQYSMYIIVKCKTQFLNLKNPFKLWTILGHSILKCKNKTNTAVSTHVGHSTLTPSHWPITVVAWLEYLPLPPGF